MKNIVGYVAIHIEWISIVSNYGYCWISKNRYVLRVTMDITEHRLDDIDGYLKIYIEWMYKLDIDG